MSSLKYFLIVLISFQLGFAQNKKYTSKQVDSLFELGNNYYKKSDYYNSLKELRFALIEAEKIKNNTLVSNISNRIGRNFAQIKNLEFSNYFFNKSLVLAKKTNNLKDQILVLNNLGNLFTAFSEKKSNQKQAISYYKQALRLAKKNNLNEDICLISMNLAWSYLKFKEYENAKPYLDDFIKLHPKYGNKLFNNIVYMLQATYYEGIGQYQLAEKTYQDGFATFSKKLIFKEKKSEYLYRYSRLLSKINKPQKAAVYLKQADSINDIFYNKEILKKAKETSSALIIEAFKIDKIKADFELKSKEQNLKLNKNIFYITLIFLAIISCFSIYILKLNKNKDKINEQLINLNIELEKAKLVAEESNEMKSKFVSTITHELRTPLFGVISLTEILEKSVIEEESRSHLKSLKYSAKYLLSLVNDVLQISKLENKNSKLEKSIFEFKSVINSVKLNLEQIAIQNNNKFVIDIDKNVNEYFCSDEVKLTQLCLNLASNALKFTKNGDVTIKIDKINEIDNLQVIKFSFIDTGFGISEENQKRIFDKFFQITPKDNFFQGSGLGLTIVNDILLLFNSKIELKSEIGKGTEFSFILKLEKASNIDQFETEVINHQFNNLNILIVDDNKINQIVTSKTIENLKGIPTIADNGFEAIEMIRLKEFDIVLMDINMPEIDGFDTTIEIRKFNKNIPIIAFTAFDKSEIQEKVQMSGISDVLNKPFTNSELIHIITKFTSSSNV